MSKQSAENYLDELLNSVNREEKHNELVEADEDFVRELKGAISADTAEEFSTANDSAKYDSPIGVKMSPKAEAEFLMEFEQELAGDDYEDFLKDFEENFIQPEDRLEDSDMELAEEEASKMSEKEEISLEELAMSGLLAEEISMDDLDMGTSSEVGPTDAIDLSQMGEEDLISLLAGADDLSDIGTLLSQNDNELPVDAEDPFATFAASEMAGQAESVSEQMSDDKKTKKGGFLEKLTSLLFGKDSEEVIDPVTLSTDSGPDVEELSDENAQILAAFAEVERAESAGSTDGKGKKNKKDKKDNKDKKKKEPKAKKPMKPKVPKKPKPKKPKEKDNTPPLPKGPVALVCLLAISIFVLVFFGPELLDYSISMSKAEDEYNKGHYAEAAAEISGLVIRDEDVMFNGKITTLAAVDSQISEYEIFMKNERKAEALDSLISAAGRVEVNDENAMTFNCAGEMDVLKNKITVELKEQFSLTYEEATELYRLTEIDRDEYTVELSKIMEELGIITE